VIHSQWPYIAQQIFGASTANKIDRSTRHRAAQNSAWCIRSRAAPQSSASFAIAASSNTHALALEYTCAILKLGVQDLPETKTHHARIAQAVADSMLSHDRGDESQIAVGEAPDSRF
jgi:hypothetical protein